MKRGKSALFLALFALLLFSSSLAAPAQAQRELTTYATWQRFEYGTLIWRADTGHIWALTNGGFAFGFPARTYSGLPDNPIFNIPRGFYRPINGFGKVWGNYPIVRLLLGNAIGTEFGFTLHLQTNGGYTTLMNVDAQPIQINPNGTWQYVNYFPPTPPPYYPPTPYPQSARVVYFSVDRTEVARGESVTLTWLVEGTQFVNLEIYDNTTATLIEARTRQPTNTSLTYTLPGAATSVRFVLWGVNGTHHPRVEDYIVQATPIIVNVTAYSGALNTYAAFQQYERGFMIWRGDSNEIFVFTGGSSGAVYYFPLSSYGGYADNPFNVPPAGYVAPINGFGRVWGNYQYVRDALGWAIGQEQGFTTTVTISANSVAGLTHPDGRSITLSINGGTWQLG